MARKPEAAKPEKPEVFVGSSAEATPLTGSVIQSLRHNFKVTPWTAGVFTPSSTALADLIRQAGKTAYSVFIFARDDKVFSRGVRYDATRDNVIFELGLFMGKLGPENCFVLVPKNQSKLKIPSDLEGFSRIKYEDDRLEESPEAAFATACAEISGAIARQKREAAAAATVTTAVSAPPPTPAPSAVTSPVAAYVQDLLGMVHQGVAGLEVVKRDHEAFTRWARNALHMARVALQAVTPGLPADAYVAWLRPRANDRMRIKFYLGENTPPDFGAAHHPFTLGEALAGSVWQDGAPAAHSSDKPHPKWKVRADCKNASYVCAPVGRPAGPGGVLGFGSDRGFKANPKQVAIMETFAAILAAAVGREEWLDPGDGGGTTRPKTASRSRGRRSRSTG